MLTPMDRLTKTLVGVPDPLFPRGVVLADEARVARARLFPPTAVYGLATLAILVHGLRSGHARAAAAAFAAGVIAWTWLEYMAHRYVLHGVFPPGPGAWRRLLHDAFDHLHVEHHRRPWDGRHINGTLKDTLWFALLLLGAGALAAPLHVGPVFVAGLTIAYVAEEWLHHSVHYYMLPFGWFRALKARHFHHHSPHGRDTGFGLSSPLWDVLLDTGPRDPALDRSLRAS